ncbi:hypothetical protein B0X71_08440 [Planococcus lenghuensis]|uniref:Uncharacterized protein n=1 Tax=Planococcus lenghuensis TaxID=2213202 RepID=A0A1Q2L3U8_9BACL|nr:hypothetical protein B0X71_08440 [Planococcus lenghuensis]
MLTLLVVVSFIVSVVSIIVALSTGKPKTYWIAVGSLYVFSMLSGFSLGQLTIAFVLVLLLLAIGSTVKLMKNATQFTAWLGAGILFSVVMMSYVDDRWLFFPMSLIN